MTPRECLTPKEIPIAILGWEGVTNREIGRIVGNRSSRITFAALSTSWASAVAWN